MPVIAGLMGLFFLSGAVVAAPAAASAPAAPIPTYTVALTGYNAVPEQTDDTPHITATGAYTNSEIIAARSADLIDELPYGTIVELSRAASDDPNCGYRKVEKLIGYRVIEDAMHPRIRNTVDILFSSEDDFTVSGVTRNAANVLGYCKEVTVRVVGRIEPRTKLPKTQKELAQIVTGKAPAVALSR